MHTRDDTDKIKSYFTKDGTNTTAMRDIGTIEARLNLLDTSVKKKSKDPPLAYIKA